jgi:hypothetical protein
MIDLAPTKYLNSNNVHGGTYTTDKTIVSPNSNNIQYASVGGSPAALERTNVRMVVGDSEIKNNNNMLLKYMNGGGKMRKSGRRGRGRSKLHRKKRSLKMRRSHKYASRSKRSKHSRSRRYSRKRGQSGGYQQYMGNTPFTLGQRIPGFPLPSNLSALANPAPFVPYQNCPGGR